MERSVIKPNEMRSKIVLAAVGALIISCSPKIVVQPTTPVPPAAPAPELAVGPAGPAEAPTPESVARGKELYNNNCGNCHKLFSPKDLPAEKWEPTLKRMQVKARLTDEDMVFIHDYVFANL